MTTEPLAFAQWWEANYADGNASGADRTFGEEVWSVAQKEAWRAVFQIVSDHCDLASREFIKMLEEAREIAMAKERIG